MTGTPEHPGDDWMDITIPEPLSVSRALARGELGGSDNPNARLMAALLTEVFGISELFTPEEFIAATRELESLGLLTDLIERRS